MSGQIYQPNFEEGKANGSLQQTWETIPSSCHRPPSDLAIPIFCYAQNGLSQAFSHTRNNQTASIFMYREFQALETCCPGPRIGDKNITSDYTTNSRCRSAACFTWSEDVARGWEECVWEKGRELNEILGREGTVGEEYKPLVRCEFVDYGRLRGSVGSGAERGKKVSMKMLLGVGMGLLVVAGGVW